MAAPIRRRRRHVTDLYDVPRSALLSHLYRSAEHVAPPNYPPLSKFAPSVLWDWVKSYLKYAFNRKHRFPGFRESPGNAMYSLGGDDGSAIRVALAGDWGAGTDEAAEVAAQMRKFDSHFTIHLGDVYYVGDPPEVNENCLGIRNPANNYDPVLWPIGSVGSFAMNGNHEMYANGNAYFDIFLPQLGLRQADGSMSGQQTSFFCIENRFWRIIAVDTGYNSIGLPILSQIPLVNGIPGVGGDCKLPDRNVQWLQDIVKPATDARGIVLLAHHQYFSAFEQRYRKPAQQLWQAGVQRPVLWFWGHEHRMAGYAFGGPDDLQVYGRCIGHGGMPIELLPPKPGAKPQLHFYDNRRSSTGFGVNGSVNLTFTGNILTASYIDLSGRELVAEKWTSDQNGAVILVSSTREVEDPNLVLTPAEDAVYKRTPG